MEGKASSITPFSDIRKKDTLNMCNSKDVGKILQKNEQLIWSGELFKINKRKRRQVRRFVLTNTRLFNLGDDKFADSFVAFFKGNKAKRTVWLKDIQFLTYSTTSNEFVLHIPKDYDYRLSSASLRNEFIYYLLCLRENIV